MSQDTRAQEAEIAVDMLGLLIIERLHDTILNAFAFGADRHTGDPTFNAWCNGALYGIASTFQLTEAEDTRDPDDVLRVWMCLCEWTQRVMAEGLDFNEHANELLARAGVDVTHRGRPSDHLRLVE